MGSRLFKRVQKLTLARPRLSGAIYDFFKIDLPNAVVIRDLRFTFEITKTLEKNANDAVIVVYNLSESTRNEFSKLPVQVQLDAGYDGEAQLLFKGDLTWANSMPEGPDWATKLQCGDGGRAIREARISRTYRSGINSKTVLKDLASAMGVELPTDVASANALTKQFASGVTVSGPASTEMGRLLSKSGFTWSIQNGKLQILTRNGVRNDEAILVNEQSGLIQSPEYGAPKRTGGKPILTVRSLILPRAIPGIKIKVESRAITGVFKLQRVSHSGDTHGDDWTTTMEATKV